VFECASGRAVAVEALLRWRHPEVGMVVPTQFLQLAEEIGLMLPVGQWVLDTACRQAKAWQDMGFDIRIGVNISGRQLRQPDIVETVAAALETSRLAPERLTLEIPEGSLGERGTETGGLLTRFAAMGVNLAIDEFGAGYSSFSTLRRLPANALKIAQAFVRNVATSSDDAEIVTAIAAVARGLHLSVVASGVETEEQYRVLADFGCDRVQGFLFSRPMTAEAMTEFLESGQVPTPFAARC
jgi:EAL domain-containing protein (putative c-di-GMP-specific phosphodiesterase class I)